ncbi:glutathione peroxidase [Aeoliella sp. SH292]|uniref:glutathione peroxidase n=1 Tax=Aeoliella sp. SH292 TaxID=3454464 RepID=UPI003F946755
MSIAEETKDKEWPAALDFTMQTLDGKEVHLGEKYDGKVVLFVNVASKCGYTPQYKGLQELHKKYGKEGLAIVGVPSNQFGGQEPGTADEIATFCEKNYGVEFDMLSKVNVKRSEEDQCPLYQYLTDKEKLPGIGSDVKWNFEKFLVGRDGEVIAHYGSSVKPESKEMVAAVEEALAAKPAE